MLEDVLKHIRETIGAEGAAIIGRDGLIISADMPTGVIVETFAIMCATIIGASVTANSEVHNRIPDRVVITSSEGNILMCGAGKKAILVVVVGPSVPMQIVIQEMKRAADKIEQTL